jgi:2,4-dienoyl-CoA reductase-like NADH-dependent reductase (Old Yellow Enzyme family)
MTQHVRFHYKQLDELKEDIARLGLDLPVSSDLSILSKPISLGGKVIPNRLAINPMEGCDGEADGRPGELTRRRYRRFGGGGAGLVWYEATAVVNEGRANPRQLYINDKTKHDFATSLGELHKAASDAGNSRPYSVIQLTHSGRYSKPGSVMERIVAEANPFLDTNPPQMRIVSDEELEQLEDKYVDAAEMAVEAGFDAIDIKACHTYLLSELLSARTREGRYGGSFENRIRALCNIVDKVKNKVGDRITLAVRLGTYNQMAYPYSWGADRDDYHKTDYTEPIELIKILWKKGVKLFGISLGNPYYAPHLTRPYNQGNYIPPVHPLEGVQLLLSSAKAMQNAVPEAVIMNAGISWLRQFAPNVAAGCIEQGWMKLAGFGRQAIAYPSFANDIVKTGILDPRNTCESCGNCTTIMRDGGCTGCVIRDKEVYAPIYKKGREGKPPATSNKVVAEHN